MLLRAAQRAPHACCRSPLSVGVLAVSRRLLSIETADPWGVLGIPRGTPRQQIKMRFYELAKTTHPDVVAPPAAVAAADNHVTEGAASAISDGPSFVEILAAFEALMDDEHAGMGGGGSSTSSSSAARGGGTGNHGMRSKGGARGGKLYRARTLGEVLCERLVEEPHAAREVWHDIVERGLEVRETMLEALFRACGARGGDGLPGALEILRHATQLGLLSSVKRQAAVIFLIKWCKEDRDSFAKIVGELSEDDKTPEVRQARTFARARAHARRRRLGALHRPLTSHTRRSQIFLLSSFFVLIAGA